MCKLVKTMYHIQQGFMQFFPQVPHFANSDQSRQRYTQKIQSPNFGLCPCTKKLLCYIQIAGKYNFSVTKISCLANPIVIIGLNKNQSQMDNLVKSALFLLPDCAFKKN